MSFTVDIKVADSAQVKEMIATMGDHIVKLSMALQEALAALKDGLLVATLAGVPDSMLAAAAAEQEAWRQLLLAPDIAAWRAKHQALAAAVKQLDDARTHEEQGYGFNALSAAAREVVG